VSRVNRFSLASNRPATVHGRARGCIRYLKLHQNQPFSPTEERLRSLRSLAAHRTRHRLEPGCPHPGCRKQGDGKQDCRDRQATVSLPASFQNHAAGDGGDYTSRPDPPNHWSEIRVARTLFPPGTRFTGLTKDARCVCPSGCSAYLDHTSPLWHTVCVELAHQNTGDRSDGRGVSVALGRCPAL
jgi:hypothetical protein